jgi:hypothetical protein
MSLNVAPHVVEPTKRSVPAVEAAATIPSGKYFLPSTLGAGKTWKYHSSPAKICRCIAAIAAIR